MEAGAFLIREYRPEDYGDCLEVWKTTRMYVREMDSRRAVELMHKLNGDLFLVAEVGGKVVGTVEAVFSGNLALIYHLAVHPDYQRRGIGKALVEEILRRLGAGGATYALVFNHSSHRDALGFYRRLGFRSIGTFRGLYIRTARARK